MSILDASAEAHPSREPLALSRRAAWTNVTTVGAAHAFLHGTSVLMPLIFPILHASYGFSYTQIGLIGAVSSFVGGLLQVVFGYLSRRVARKVMIGIGNVVVAIATFLTGTAATFAPFLGWSLLRGVGSAPQHPAGNSLLADTFGDKRSGFAVAAHVTAGNIGTLAVPILGALLIKRLGWQPTLMLFALPGLLAGSAVLLLAQESPQIGPDTPPPTAAVPQASSSSQRSIFAPLRHRGVLLVIAASMLAAGGRGLGIVTKYVPLYLSGPLRLQSDTVATLYTLLLIGSVISPLIAGRVSDRFGRRPVLYASYGLAGLFTVLLPLVAGSALPLLLIEITLLGLTVYIEAPVLQAYLIDSAPPAERDPAMGWYFTIIFGAGSLWDLGLGSLVDATHSFVPDFAVMALSYLGAAFILVWMPRSPRA